MTGLFSNIKKKVDDQIKDEKMKMKIKIKSSTNEKVIPEPEIILEPEKPIKKYTVTPLKSNLQVGDKVIWSEKYRPKKLTDVIGYESQIETIRKWFIDFKNKNVYKNILLFSGSPGTAKTSIAHAVLKEFDYLIIEYNASDVRNKSQIEESLGKLIGYNNNFGIIMDEVDGMSTGDKGGMAQLIKTINPYKSLPKGKKPENSFKYPVICICNNNYDKKITDLKKECLEIIFEKPSINDLIKVINKITKEEQFIIDDNAKNKIAELAQGDYRRLIFILENFYNIFKTGLDKITLDIVTENYTTITQKYVTMTYYESTGKILGQPRLSVEEIYKIYERDKLTLPMMIHENYPNVIEAQTCSPQSKLKQYRDFIDTIITGDIIEKLMFANQAWNLQNMHGIKTCYVAHSLSNKYPLHKRVPIKWTSTLTKFSSQKSTIKNINNISMIINGENSYSTNDIQSLSRIILFELLDEKGNKQKGIELLTRYNLTIADIEKLIRTDQLSDKYNILYNSKNKTFLLKNYSYLKQKEISIIQYNQAKVKSVKKITKKNIDDDDNSSDESSDESSSEDI